MKKKGINMHDKYIKLLAQQIAEGKFSYDKKTATMKRDNSDPDQRHGLYRDGKLVKTYNTKGEADNVKSRDPKFKDATVKKIAEGGMGGLNRCAAAQDVSFEKVLSDVKDKWKGDTVTVTEIGKDKAHDWADKSRAWRSKQDIHTTNPKIIAKADQRGGREMKIHNKHGHKNDPVRHSKELEESYADRLKKFI